MASLKEFRVLLVALALFALLLLLFVFAALVHFGTMF